jgi:hypothetical protein
MKTRKSSPADYVPAVNGIRFERLSATVEGNLPKRSLLSALKKISGVQESSTWWLGDLLRYGELKEVHYAEIAEATGMAVGSLRNIASISGKVPPEVRVAGLPWRTHKVVARFSGDEDKMRYWLGRAKAKGIKSDDLEREINAGKSAGSRQEDNDLHGTGVCPVCERPMKDGVPARVLEEAAA